MTTTIEITDGDRKELEHDLNNFQKVVTAAMELFCMESPCGTPFTVDEKKRMILAQETLRYVADMMTDDILS